MAQLDDVTQALSSSPEFQAVAGKLMVQESAQRSLQEGIVSMAHARRIAR